MSPSPHRPGLSSLLAAALVAASCLVFSAPALAGDPSTSIKVNEVESAGLADFVELANTSSTRTDVGGLVLKDNDDAHTLSIPAGTRIPAGGFLAVNTDVPGGFDLGSSDSAESRVIPVESLEVAVLDRTRSQSRKFKCLTDPELADLLGEREGTEAAPSDGEGTAPGTGAGAGAENGNGTGSASDDAPVAPPVEPDAPA